MHHIGKVFDDFVDDSLRFSFGNKFFLKGATKAIPKSIWVVLFEWLVGDSLWHNRYFHDNDKKQTWKQKGSTPSCKNTFVWMAISSTGSRKCNVS